MHGYELVPVCSQLRLSAKEDLILGQSIIEEIWHNKSAIADDALIEEVQVAFQNRHLLLRLCYLVR